MHLQPKIKIWMLPITLLALALACSMPGASQPTLQPPPISGEGEAQIGEALADPTQPPPPAANSYPSTPTSCRGPGRSTTGVRFSTPGTVDFVFQPTHG
jgi:hypothetical protein